MIVRLTMTPIPSLAGVPMRRALLAVDSPRQSTPRTEPGTGARRLVKVHGNRHAGRYRAGQGADYGFWLPPLTRGPPSVFFIYGHR